MGYPISIDTVDLRCYRDIRPELAREDLWYVGYYQEKGHVHVSNRDFNGDEAFITDLLQLRELGVRGTVIVVDMEGEWVKYALRDKGVEEYSGQVVFSQEPGKVYLNETPLIVLQAERREN